MAGFRKPHAPWQYPKRMWDLYNQSAIKVAEHKVLPTGTPLIAWSRQLGVHLENGTGFSYDANTPVPDWVMQDQRHAYYSSVSCVIREKDRQSGGCFPCFRWAARHHTCWGATRGTRVINYP